MEWQYWILYRHYFDPSLETTMCSEPAQMSLIWRSWNSDSECGTLHVEYSHSDIRSQIRRAGNVKRGLAQRFFADTVGSLKCYYSELKTPPGFIWMSSRSIRTKALEPQCSNEKTFLFSIYKAFFLIKIHISIYSWLGFLLLSFMHLFKKNPEYFVFQQSIYSHDVDIFKIILSLQQSPIIVFRLSEKWFEELLAFYMDRKKKYTSC